MTVYGMVIDCVKRRLGKRIWMIRGYNEMRKLGMRTCMKFWVGCL